MNLKIWHKMVIGISIPALIALIGGILTYKYLSDVENRQGFVEIADDLKEQVLEVRRNEKNFLLHKDDEYYKYFIDAITILNDSINRISLNTMIEIGREDFLIFRKSIETYSGLIDDLYKHYQEETNVIEEVREQGRKLESFVSGGNHAQELTTSYILNLRRLEKNYMLFRDRDSFVKLDNVLSDLKNITPLCYECSPYVDAIYNLSGNYNKSERMVNELQVMGTKFEEITNKIAASERHKVNSFLKRTRHLLLIALASFCILGPFLVYKTATYIVAPIKRLADITRKISEGDLTLRAPLKEHDETHTLALSFNTMLDHLQLTHESLEKSLDLLREKQAQLVESKKLASIGTLASGVAHELNNPLNNIYTTAQRLIKKSGDECPPFI